MNKLTQFFETDSIFTGLLLISLVLSVGYIIGFTGLFFCLSIYLILYAFSYYYVLKNQILKRNEINIIFLIITLINAFVYSIIIKEKYIYYWDFRAYWNITEDTSNLIFSNLSSTLKQWYHSIQYDVYNITPSIFLSLPVKLLGASYLSYVLSILNIFIIPCFFVLAILIQTIIRETTEKNIKLYNIFFVLALFPPMFNPLLYGYLDSVGLFFISLILFIIYHDELIKFNLIRNIALSCLLLFLIFSRRWYGFWFETFFIALTVTNFIKFFIEKNYTWVHLKNYLINISFIGSFCFLILLCFFYPFLARSVFNDYNFTHSAYKLGGLLFNLVGSFNYFGIGLFLLALVGVIFGCIYYKSRYLTIFTLIQLSLIWILFNRMESLGWHHQYLFCSQILIFLALGIFIPYIKLQKNLYKFLYLLVVISLLTFNFISNYFHQLNSKFLSTHYQTSRVRNDIETIKQIDYKLNNLVKENEKIYVLASSFIMSDEIFKNAFAPESRNPVPAMLNTYHVDEISGFPYRFFEADIVVVGDPVQYHLDPKHQRMIGILAKDILSGKNIGAHYQLINDKYELDNHVRVKIYRKLSNLTQADFDYLLNKIKRFYPDHEELWLNKAHSLNG
ncbi:hypothetical protein [Legionella gresilensis]|uniref:hypothetical protein n=1 Tax=Legionella gresilensis TaxID=91823 RepID=UPI0010410ADD|nr:hypothetical protein [Legionella gresilensis]